MSAPGPAGFVLAEYVASLFDGGVADPDGTDADPSGNGREDLAVGVFAGWNGIDMAVLADAVGKPVPAAQFERPDASAPAWLSGWTELGSSRVALIAPAGLLSPGAALAEARFWLPDRDGGVALVLGELPRTETVAADTVVWRGQGSARPWLAGTASERRMVLLDLVGLADMARKRKEAGIE